MNTSVKLTSNQKTQLLTNSFDECMRNHICGNYITLPDMTCIEWGIETRKYNHNLYMGDVKLKYDFDFSFDSNLQALYDLYIEKHINDIAWED